MLTTEYRVERFSWVFRGRELYGYCEDQGEYQLLVRYWKLFGYRVWRQVVDREEIPSYVWIAAATLGCYDSGVWQSTFHKYL